MYNISDNSMRTAYNAAVTHQVREFQNRISFGHWSGTPRTFVSDLSFTKGIRSLITNPVVISDSSMLTMGNACSASLKLDFYKPDTNVNLSNKVIRVESGLKVGNDYVYTPCGYFNISEFSSDDDYKTIKITGYDDMEKLSAKWNSQLTYPQTAKSVINEIATANCFSVEYSSFANTALNRSISAAQAAILMGYTVREVLGILAGIGGSNAFFNQSGVLCFKWFTDCGVEVPLRLQWQDGLKKTQVNDFPILSITSGIDDNVFTSGTGEGITFINPLITQSEVQAIWNAVKNTSYLPCEVLWRGNPLVECGDAVAILDKNGTSHTVFVANQKIDLTGGFSQNIVCPTADGEISFQTADERTQQALNRVRTDLQQAIAEVTARIIGTNGGYITPLDTDNDDNIDTIIISENPVDPEHPERTTGDVIRVNKNGIGVSSTGYNGPFQSAITGRGINADAITAGQISTEMLEISTASENKNVTITDDSVVIDNGEFEVLTGSAVSVGVNPQGNLVANNGVYIGGVSQELVVVDDQIDEGVVVNQFKETIIKPGSITLYDFNNTVPWLKADCTNKSFIVKSQNNSEPTADFEPDYTYTTSGGDTYHGAAALAGDLLQFMTSSGAKFIEMQNVGSVFRQIFRGNQFDILTKNGNYIIKLLGQDKAYLWTDYFEGCTSGNNKWLEVSGRDHAYLWTNNCYFYNSAGYKTAQINDSSTYFVCTSRFAIRSATNVDALWTVPNSTGVDLRVSCDVYSRGYKLSSSQELKTNIEPAHSMLSKVLSADICNYDYVGEVEESEDDEESGEVGLNSEEEEHIPQHYGLVIGEGYNTPEEVISKDGEHIDLYSMISIAWKAIQEQQAIIDALEQRIAALESNT